MKTLFLYISFLLCFVAFGQTQKRAIDLSVGIGLNTYQSENLSLEQYRNLLPESDLLQKDYSDFSNQDNYYSNASTLFNILWGIGLGKNQTNETKFRIGFQYSQYTSHTLSKHYSETTVYDTLTSSQTGQEVYLDSTTFQNLYVSSHQDLVVLDLSYILRSNPNGTWQFYSGIGLQLGGTINAKAEVEFSEGDYLDGYIARNYNNYNNRISHQQNESFKFGSSFYSQIYLPIGIELRLGKNNPFWSRMHLFSEFKPGLQLVCFQNENAEIKPNLGIVAFGVRHEF